MFSGIRFGFVPLSLRRAKRMPNRPQAANIITIKIPLQSPEKSLPLSMVPKKMPTIKIQILIVLTFDTFTIFVFVLEVASSKSVSPASSGTVDILPNFLTVIRIENITTRSEMSAPISRLHTLTWSLIKGVPIAGSHHVCSPKIINFPYPIASTHPNMLPMLAIMMPSIRKRRRILTSG